MNWNLIEEKTPTENKEYIVSVKNEFGGYTVPAYYILKNKIWVHNDNLLENVYAWTELPAPINLNKAKNCGECEYYKDFTKGRYACTNDKSPYNNYVLSRDHDTCKYVKTRAEE